MISLPETKGGQKFSIGCDKGKKIVLMRFNQSKKENACPTFDFQKGYHLDQYFASLVFESLCLFDGAYALMYT